MTTTTRRHSAETTNSTKAQNAQLRKSTKAEAKGEAQVLPLCQCGCQKHVVTHRASFLSGHDMKLRSLLLRQFDEGREEAAVELVGRGWYTNDDLEARAEKRQAEAQAKLYRAAKREADKEAKEREKAAAKEAKASKAEAATDDEAAS